MSRFVLPATCLFLITGPLEADDHPPILPPAHSSPLLPEVQAHMRMKTIQHPVPMYAYAPYSPGPLLQSTRCETCGAVNVGEACVACRGKKLRGCWERFVNWISYRPDVPQRKYGPSPYRPPLYGYFGCEKQYPPTGGYPTGCERCSLLGRKCETCAEARPVCDVCQAKGAVCQTCAAGGWNDRPVAPVQPMPVAVAQPKIPGFGNGQPQPATVAAPPVRAPQLQHVVRPEQNTGPVLIAPVQPNQVVRPVSNELAPPPSLPAPQPEELPAPVAPMLPKPKTYQVPNVNLDMDRPTYLTSPPYPSAYRR